MALVYSLGLLTAGILLAILLQPLFSPVLRRNGQRLRKPPNTLPFVGNGILFLQARQKLFAWFAKCERQFGYETLQISVPTLPPGVVISDPRNVEYVFKNEGIFSKGEFVKQRSRALFGQGIINVDGELWKVQRKAGLHFLNINNLRVLTDIALPQYLSKSIDYLKERATPKRTVVDLQLVFHEITTQLMGKLAYDVEMHAEDAFATSFDYASGVTAERFQNPLWFITDNLRFKFRRALKLLGDEQRQIVANAAKERITAADKKAGTATKSKLDEISGSLIHSLLDLIGDEQMVADAALNYLTAGRDTTAQALTWAFYLLMKGKHQHCLEKLREEVRRVLDDGVPNQDSHKLDSKRFTPSTMPYTMAVFYETLRLYPPIPFEFRQCEEATTLPDGTELPKGTVVVWCTWAMDRSTITWGHDADEFKPERWLDGNKLVSKSASEFPVFNGGPRTCLGKKMAELMAVQSIATMAWLFDFEPEEGPDQERVSKSSLTLPMDGGLPVFVRQRTI